MGNTRYYTKANGQSYAELTYDAWGMPESPNKLLNNNHGNYVYATYTGHIFDTTLDIYFAGARFYDANTRTWLAMDLIKDGDNWYQYCYSNPVGYMDPYGLFALTVMGVGALIGGGVGIVSNLIEQAIDNEPFSLGELVVNAVGGATSGAIAASPLGLGTAFALSVGVDVAVSGLTESIRSLLATNGYKCNITYFDCYSGS